MKRKEQFYEKQPFAKKHKTTELTETQKRVADKTIPFMLEQEKINLVKIAFELDFNTPKKVETFLTYSHYQIFWWAVEHQNFELIEYLLHNTTERGKFLIVCHDDYELIKKFVEFNLQKISEKSYQALPAVETLKILINANPNTAEIIIKAVSRFIDEKASEDTVVANTLRESFKSIFADYIEKENKYYEADDESTAISSVNNCSTELGLIGELLSDDHSLIL